MFSWFVEESAMRIAEIMSTDVETVAPDDTVATARDKMSFHRIHHLVVVDGESITGVVSSRDLEGADDDAPIEQVMNPIAVVAHPETKLREAASLLRAHIIGCLPVVEGSRLVGIVTITDFGGGR
jgi:CBS domain-containing protein